MAEKTEVEFFEDSQIQDSEDIIDVHVDLPDLDETQIVDEFADQREVSLFTSVKAGKVTGAESTPFILPRRWTFQTLKNCVVDFIGRNNPNKKVEIKQLYYKRARGKGVVKMDGDGDITALLKEYPLAYPSGKKKDSVLMYLAVDVQEINSKGTPEKTSSVCGPRRSPRLIKKDMDIFLYAVDDGKISSSSRIIHNVPKTATIKELTNLVQEQNCDDVIYVPAKGMYWIRKGSKQLVSIKTQEDFDAGKNEYDGSKSMRIACATVPDLSLNVGLNGSQSRKRKLNMNQATSTSTSAENDTWNTIHLTLVRDLESKGIKHRYGVKHLKLWTDMIVDGRLAGIGEEPEWIEHLEEVIVPPKSRRSNSPSLSSSTSSTAAGGFQGGFMEMMMLNQQRMEESARRSEMLQTTLLTMMTSSIAMMQNKVTGSPNSTFTHSGTDNYTTPMRSTTAPRFEPEKMVLKNFNQDECCNFISSLGLNKYVTQFQEHQMDGQLLCALTHPHFGKMMLNSMGFSEDEQDLLIQAINSAQV